MNKIDSKKKKIILIVALIVFLVIIGATAARFLLPMLAGGKRGGQPPRPPKSEVSETLAEETTAERETETEDAAAVTANAAETYYIFAVGGTPLYAGAGYYEKVIGIVPDGEKVEVTEVQTGNGLDGLQIEFGKITYGSQTGWIKMDRTASVPSGSGAKKTDYDVVLWRNAEYWKDAGADVLSAYAGIVSGLTEEYGTGRFGETVEGGKSLCGLFVVRLIDLDLDGRPELYCAYAKEGESLQAKSQAVYRYADGEAERLYEGMYTAKGSDYSPLVWFREVGGVLYFVAGSGPDRFFYRLKDGEWTGAEFMGWADYYVDAVEVTEEEYEDAIAKYEDGAVNYTLSIAGYYSESAEANAYTDAILAETENVASLLAAHEK